MLKSIKRHINKIQNTGANFLIKKQGINNIKSELIKKIKINVKMFEKKRSPIIFN